MYAGQKQYFDQIRIERKFEEFKNHQQMTLKIPVVPEYSYLISGSFVAEFGILTPGENLTSQGEIERLTRNLGCFIKYDFVFRDLIDEEPIIIETKKILIKINLYLCQKD